LKQEIAVFLDSPKAHGNYRKLKNCWIQWYPELFI
jgi:hypothetical protein